RRWTEPIAALHPKVVATRSRTGWGQAGANPTLAAVMVDQVAFADLLAQSDASALLTDWHGPFQPRAVPLTGRADLEALMIETAEDGRSNASEWGSGAWGWLYDAVALRPWVREALAEAIANVMQRTTTPERVALAALDWMSEAWD